ncbi:hypothetical protein AB0399_08465 [Streptomyces sp. NPDC088194]|uniref:hypothetical protein n=1 Tax=Streptomyces sp. NPDC088194 TaxID=3154931 RepID=UPI00344D15EB
MSALNIVLLVSGVGYVLARRIIGEALEAGPVLAAPVVLGVLGLVTVRDARPAGGATVALIAASCLLGVAVGLARGLTVRLGTRDGARSMRYGAGSLLLWLLGAAFQVALSSAGRAVAAASGRAADQGVLLSVGLGVLAESLVVLFRATRARPAGAEDQGGHSPAHREPGDRQGHGTSRGASGCRDGRGRW